MSGSVATDACERDSPLGRWLARLRSEEPHTLRGQSNGESREIRTARSRSVARNDGANGWARRVRGAVQRNEALAGRPSPSSNEARRC